MFPPPHFNEGTHRSPHHVPQKTVRRNPEVPVLSRVFLPHYLQMTGCVRFPEGVIDGADGGFVVPASLFEAGEVVGAK